MSVRNGRVAQPVPHDLRGYWTEDIKRSTSDA